MPDGSNISSILPDLNDLPMGTVIAPPPASPAPTICRWAR